MKRESGSSYGRRNLSRSQKPPHGRRQEAADTKARMKREAIATSMKHHPTRPPEPRPLERARGCLVGGAVGDALGAPIEFLSLEQIRSKFGAQGVTQFEEAYGRLGATTEDTQMNFFTGRRPPSAQSFGAASAAFRISTESPTTPTSAGSTRRESPGIRSRRSVASSMAGWYVRR